MAYQVLARKYRPQRFADVIGQEHVTRTLLNALRQGRIAHGYIFSGHRGIGKTTVARILAAALDCRNEIGSPLRPTPEPCNVCESCVEIRQGNAVDVIEIDAATNRGIDEIRELRDAARYRPARDRYKIYILDEAHQITDAAFNALLKTLEEPPEHIVFMMATTQPEDIPQTIRSRCQHYSFHAVRMDDLFTQLRAVAEAEDIDASDDALSLLAEAGDGSVRDALSIMDQAIASAPLLSGGEGAPERPRLEAEQVRSLMGAVSNGVFEEILEAVARSHAADVLRIIGRLLDAGNGPQPIARQFVRYLRNCLMAQLTRDDAGQARELLQISAAERERAGRSASLFSEEELTRFLGVMLRTFDDLGYRQEPRLHLELGVLKLVHLQRLLPIEQLLSQLEPAGASPTPRPAAAKPDTAPVPRPDSLPRQSQPATVAVAKPAVRASKTSPGVASALAPEPASEPEPEPDRSTAAASPVLEPAQAPQPPFSSSSAQQDLQAALVATLSAHGSQQTAADALHDASLEVANGALRIQTTLSKAMLPIVFNPEADRLLREALRRLPDAPPRFELLPGSTSEAAVKRKARPAAAGSAAERAEKHPIVQQARELFAADISNVIDLRES